MEFSRRTLAEWDADMEPACETGDPDMPDGHQGHHMHVEGNMFICSCGTGMGVFSFVPDPRFWSDDPAEVEAANREMQEWFESISCSVCHKPGVQAERDWGVTSGVST
jgi:hypothetical protein